MFWKKWSTLLSKRKATDLKTELERQASSNAQALNSVHFPDNQPTRQDFEAWEYKFFPEEADTPVLRAEAWRCATVVGNRLAEARNSGTYTAKKKFGPKEAIASATWFGHSDTEHKYNLTQVYAASKRHIITLNLNHDWDTHGHDVFAVHQLLGDGLEELPGRK